MAGEVGAAIPLPILNLGQIIRGNKAARAEEKARDAYRRERDASILAAAQAGGIAARVERSPYYRPPRHLGPVGRPVGSSEGTFYEGPPVSRTSPGTAGGPGAGAAIIDTLMRRWQELAALADYMRSIFSPVPAAVPGGYLGGFDMPMNFLPAAYPDTGGGWAGALAGLGQGIASVIGSIRSPQSMPGGALMLGNYGVATQGGTLSTVANAAQGCSAVGTPFGAGAMTATPQTFAVANPVTGRMTWFRPAGRPILWSSDLSACRRVRKVAGKARRRLGGR